MIILREGWVNHTRRTHFCWYCQNHIQVGERAFVQVGTYDGVQSAYCHAVCHEHINRFGELDHENLYYPHETGNLEQIKKEVEHGTL